MTLNNRAVARTLAKLTIQQALHKSNVSAKDIASVFGTAKSNVETMLSTSDGTRHLMYADLMCLAGDPQTRELVRLLVAPLLKAVDAQQLRVVDLQGMANDTMTADLVRIILRPTVDKLWPANTTQNDVQPEPRESTK